MNKALRIIIATLSITLSSTSMAHLLDVNGTHYHIAWITDSYASIVAENPYAFTSNVWWNDIEMASIFSLNWSRFGTATPGLLEFAWDVLDLRNYGDYCRAIDCVVTVGSSYGDNYWWQQNVIENYADVVWTYAFATVVPEPAAVPLLLFAAAGLWFSSRRKKLNVLGSINC